MRETIFRLLCPARCLPSSLGMTSARIAVRSKMLVHGTGAKDTEWASINLGVLLCIDCSGAHRGLGERVERHACVIVRSTHYKNSINCSRSVDASSFGGMFRCIAYTHYIATACMRISTFATITHTPTCIWTDGKYMRSLGNAHVNAIYEAGLDKFPDITRPSSASTKVCVTSLSASRDHTGPENRLHPHEIRGEKVHGDRRQRKFSASTGRVCRIANKPQS
jgi:hypothetical protein